jgi:hypothetical protein
MYADEQASSSAVETLMYQDEAHEPARANKTAYNQAQVLVREHNLVREHILTRLPDIQA